MFDTTNTITPLVTVGDLGGYGDVIAGVNLLQTLDREGMEPQTHFDTEAKEKFEEVAPRELQDQVDTWLETDDDERLVAITPVRDKRSHQQRKKSDIHLSIEEYDDTDRDIERSRYDDRITVRTGLGFEESIADVQAGIYRDEEIDELLDDIETAFDTEAVIQDYRQDVLDEVLADVETEASDYLDEEELVDGRWSFLYKSSVGSMETFFDIVEEAENELDDELYLFTASGDGRAMDAARDRGWDGYRLTERELAPWEEGKEPVTEAEDSPVTVIEMGTIPNSQFKRMNVLADSLSLVTGDHSYSQAMQQAQSEVAAPFLYQCANWKKDLAGNMVQYMEETDEEAAALFSEYIAESRSMSAFRTDKDVEDLARLFYDEELQERYNEAVAQVKDGFVRDREEAGIEEAERLWSVNETVQYIVDHVEQEETASETYQPLLPDEDRVEDPPLPVYAETVQEEVAGRLKKAKDYLTELV
ncbi:MAG: hypothetical protein SVU32_07485 [Candidatus Nanohaloarchaea archaeon]|nr:hypothetical protein [Candidatus Nanohaloarchaea archaeon]